MKKLLIALFLFPSLVFAQSVPFGPSTGGDGSSGIIIGSTTITGGANAGIVYDNSGVAGEYTISGTGTVVAMRNSPIFITPNLGTPAAGIITNLTGTCAACTANTVTTNANLTGPITSVGNATSIAAQTGTGTTFVTQASPTLTGVLTLANGAVGAPSLNFGDATTGLYRSSADAIIVTNSGVANLAIFSSGVRLKSLAPFGWSSGDAVSTIADTIITRAAAATFQHGAADVTAGAVAQIVTFQGNTASTTNGPLALIRGAGGGSSTSVGGELRLSGGLSSAAAGTGGAITFYTAPAASGNAAVLALTIDSTRAATFAAGVTISGAAVLMPALASDAATTDATVCVKSSDGTILKGSGTLGICLGTSSARYKTDIHPLTAGLNEVLALPSKTFYLDKEHGDPMKQMYGFTAEDCAKVLPKLVGFDGEGRANTCDYLGIVPVLVHAVQEQQAQIESLKVRLQ